MIFLEVLYTIRRRIVRRVQRCGTCDNTLKYKKKLLKKLFKKMQFFGFFVFSHRNLYLFAGFFFHFLKLDNIAHLIKKKIFFLKRPFMRFWRT